MKRKCVFCRKGLQPYKEEVMTKANKAVFDANAQCCDIMNHLIKEETMEKEEETFGECIEKTIQECLFGKKEAMEDIIKINIPKGYEFASIDNQQVVFEKVKPKCPKTYKKCAEIVKFNIEEEPTIFGYKEELLDRFQKLLICRDAYWKIAGEQMGLGKPWEPDWRNSNEDKYCIEYSYGRINSVTTNIYNYILAFPTAEMRDAFYENFKDLINETKELL